MKKKYYYDCLIQALYMNKEFGVKFYTAFKSDFLDKELGFCADIRGIYNVLSSDNKIYVEPESEHIFEPKDDDLGIYDGGELWRFITGKWYFRNDFEDRTEDYDFITNIIKRDNKHFFNPKEEN